MLMLFHVCNGIKCHHLSVSPCPISKLILYTGNVFIFLPEKIALSICVEFITLPVLSTHAFVSFHSPEMCCLVNLRPHVFCMCESKCKCVIQCPTTSTQHTLFSCLLFSTGWENLQWPWEEINGYRKSMDKSESSRLQQSFIFSSKSAYSTPLNYFTSCSYIAADSVKKEDMALKYSCYSSR